MFSPCFWFTSEDKVESARSTRKCSGGGRDVGCSEGGGELRVVIVLCPQDPDGALGVQHLRGQGEAEPQLIYLKDGNTKRDKNNCLRI